LAEFLKQSVLHWSSGTVTAIKIYERLTLSNWMQ